MKTFGLMMIIANLAFVYPEYVEATVGALGRMLVRRTAPHVQKPPHMQKQSAATPPALSRWNAQDPDPREGRQTKCWLPV